MTMKALRLIALVAFTWLLHSHLTAQTVTSKNSGEWNDSTTWEGGKVPSSSDAVVIQITHTVTLKNKGGSGQNLT